MVKPNDISNYLKQIGKKVPFAFRKKLITELRHNISEYIDEYPNSTIEDVIDHFGTPEKFADEYILAMDENARKEAIYKAGLIKKSIFITLAIMLLIITTTAIWIICENSQTAGYYYEEVING